MSAGKNATLLLEQSISCPVLLDTGVMGTETIGAPLYQYAYYGGQGFGRVLEHTVSACLVAFILKRPCLINVSPRDPHNTWRSFIHENTYRWDPSIIHDFPEYAEQLEGVAGKLPNMKFGSWGAALNAADYDIETNDTNLVFPMNEVFDKTDWQKFLDYYSGGTNAGRRKQVLFSPNWSDAWFTKLPTTEILGNEYGCGDREQLTTMLQNSMYGPTDLARQLHQERYNYAATTAWNNSIQEEVTHALSDADQPTQRTKPHLSDIDKEAVKSLPSYGSIHIRTVMVNLKENGKPIQPDAMALMIRSCLNAAFEISNSEFPENWWILSDNATVAEIVENDIQKEQLNSLTIGRNNSMPVLKMFKAYDMEVAREQDRTGKFLSSTHSMHKDSIGLYGHPSMAGSIKDWMALYESEISIVTKNTAYGYSGARGNDKVPSKSCGKYPGEKRDFFTVFVEPPEWLAQKSAA